MLLLRIAMREILQKEERKHKEEERKNIIKQRKI